MVLALKIAEIENIRALLGRPPLLLLDEPLSALDAPLRERLRPELRRLLSDSCAPVLLVTHDRLDVIALADRVAVVDAGEIRQTGSVDEIFRRPVDARVAGIVGIETVREGRVLRVEKGVATADVGGVEIAALADDGIEGEVFVCIRAEDVILERGSAAASSVRNRLASRIDAVEAAGPTVRVVLDAGFPLVALVTRAAREELGLVPGQRVTALVKAHAVHLVPRAIAR
jgi:molybdate transport system ATP-binding protein